MGTPKLFADLGGTSGDRSAKPLRRTRAMSCHIGQQLGYNTIKLFDPPRKRAGDLACNFGLVLGKILIVHVKDVNDHGDGTPPPRSNCHEIVLGSEFIVRADCCCCTMKKPTILVLDDRRERGMNLVAHCKLGGMMNRRSHERVSKPHFGCIEIDRLAKTAAAKASTPTFRPSSTSQARMIS
jgi:hypothetical protein